MFSSILEYLIPRPKTPVELAVKKIEKQQFMRGALGNDIDPKNRTHFIIGKITIMGSGMGSVCMEVSFDSSDSQATIKYDGDVMFYFNDKNDVLKIRQAIVDLHSKLAEERNKDKARRFSEL